MCDPELCHEVRLLSDTGDAPASDQSHKIRAKKLDLLQSLSGTALMSVPLLLSLGCLVSEHRTLVVLQPIHSPHCGLKWLQCTLKG